MDKKQFKQFVESVAEIKDLTPKKDPGIRLDNDAEDTCRVGDEWIEITAKSNPTLGFKFIKLKDVHRECQLGCGDMVSNQVVERRYALTPQRHWRTRCQNCGCYVSPDGKGFIEGGHQIAAAYIRYFNGQPVTVETKQIETPKGPARVTEYETHTETITNDGIIRQYK